MNRFLPRGALLAAAGVVLVSLRTVPADRVVARAAPARAACDVPAIPTAGPAIRLEGRDPGAEVAPSPPSTLPDEPCDVLRGRDIGPETLQSAPTRLVENLRRSPGTVSAAVRRIRDADCPADEAGRLLASLAAAGTEACQEGILAVIADADIDAARRLQALRSLAPVREPIPAVDPLLERLVRGAGPLAGEALEAWAIVAGRVRDRAPERFEPAAARVRDALETASSCAELCRALYALGHLGLPEMPIRVFDATRERDENVRLAAVRALRHVAAADAGETLLRSAREDASPSVRLAALESLATRRERVGGTPCDALRAIAEADADAPVRARAAEILADLEAAG